MVLLVVRVHLLTMMLMLHLMVSAWAHVTPCGCHVVVLALGTVRCLVTPVELHPMMAGIGTLRPRVVWGLLLRWKLAGLLLLMIHVVMRRASCVPREVRLVSMESRPMLLLNLSRLAHLRRVDVGLRHGFILAALRHVTSLVSIRVIVAGRIARLRSRSTLVSGKVISLARVLLLMLVLVVLLV